MERSVAWIPQSTWAKCSHRSMLAGTVTKCELRVLPLPAPVLRLIATILRGLVRVREEQLRRKSWVCTSFAPN